MNQCPVLTTLRIDHLLVKMLEGMAGASGNGQREWERESIGGRGRVERSGGSSTMVSPKADVI